jgi:ABC-type Fe3+ transport system permease subunit
MLSKLTLALRSYSQVTIFYYLLFFVLIFLVLYPILMLLTASFFTGQPGAWGQFTLAGYRELYETEGIAEIFFNSLIYASARTGISLLLALIFAWAVARGQIPYRGLMEVLLPIPFFIPDLLTAISWVMIANPQNGLINQFFFSYFGVREPVVNIYGWGGLIFHSVLSTTAFLYLLLVGFFYNMDPSYEEASTACGASQFLTTFKITLPMLLPAILGVSILSFIRGLESFEDPYLFGTPGGVYVFANEIYRVLRHRHPPQYNAATGLAVILMIITFILVTAQWKILGNREFTTISAKGYQPRRIKPHPVIGWSIFALFVVYFTLAILIPLTQICASSFFKVFGLYNPEHFTFDNWLKVLRDPRTMGGLRNTIIFSTLAAAGVITLGGLYRLHSHSNKALARTDDGTHGLVALDSTRHRLGVGSAVGLDISAPTLQSLRDFSNCHPRLYRQRTSPRNSHHAIRDHAGKQGLGGMFHGPRRVLAPDHGVHRVAVVTHRNCWCLRDCLRVIRAQPDDSACSYTLTGRRH